MPTITIKSLGRTKNNIPDWSVQFPSDWYEQDGDSKTLRDIIERIVRTEVDAFRKRQNERRFVKFLTAKQIEESLQKGKVDMGGQELEQEVNDEIAVGTAIEAFEDGLYYVLIDGEQQLNLDQQVYLTSQSQITFIRLTMLAGG